MAMPEEEERGIPEYMVSFGDMITLLLTFFIMLVALADRQQAGLVGAGQGPVIKHLLAQGRPGINVGRLQEHQLEYKRDMWWIPDQEGDPDQLEAVREKLDRELPVLFRPGEASLLYEQDHLVIRLPAHIEFDEHGQPIISAAVRGILQVVTEAVRYSPERFVRINGHAPRVGRYGMELYESGRYALLLYQNLRARGVSGERMSVWGWGASRPVAPQTPGSPVNRGVSIEIFDARRQADDRSEEGGRP